MGNQIDEAKERFWNALHEIVIDKYEMSGIQAVNKLSWIYMSAASLNCEPIAVASVDNLIKRVSISKLSPELINQNYNSGFFFEYETNDILELREICNDLRIQTISYIGNKELFMQLIYSGIKGVDRIVPIGNTMDFDLLWDGYNLFERLTRVISLG